MSACLDWLHLDWLHLAVDFTTEATAVSDFIQLPDSTPDKDAHQRVFPNQSRLGTGVAASLPAIGGRLTPNFPTLESAMRHRGSRLFRGPGCAASASIRVSFGWRRSTTAVRRVLGVGSSTMTAVWPSLRNLLYLGATHSAFPGICAGLRWKSLRKVLKSVQGKRYIRLHESLANGDLFNNGVRGNHTRLGHNSSYILFYSEPSPLTNMVFR